MMEARWLLIGPEDTDVGTLKTISTSTVVNAGATTNGSSLSVSYTAPVGSDLVLVVAGGGQSTNAGRVLPTAVSFNSVALTKAAEVRNTTSTYSGVGLWSRSVSSGESGTITITWGGNNQRRTLAAYTLIGAQNSTEATATAYSNSGATTTGLTTITDGAMVVAAGSVGSGLTMTAVGTDHAIDTQRTASSLSTAIGHVPVTSAGAITGIGFSTTPAPSNMEVVLAAFTPAMDVATITDVSNNKYDGVAYNTPVYRSSNLKYTRT
jgi:hypothetical protein